MDSRQNIFRPGVLGPLILAFFLCTDFISRFFSVDPLVFNPNGAVSRFRFPDTPFEPGKFYASNQVYGDIARSGNARDYRHLKTEIWTCDAWGYRNKPAVAQAVPDGLLFGDSFAAGFFVSDDETLSVQLSKATSKSFYNAGGVLYNDRSLMKDLYPPLLCVPSRILALAQRLHMHHGTVIYLISEGNFMLSVQEVTSQKWTIWTKHKLADLIGEAGATWWYARLHGMCFVSPFRIVMENLFNFFFNGKTLPNSQARNISIRKLKDGEIMLMHSPDYIATLSSHYSNVEDAVEYCKFLKRDLQDHHFNLLVLLVPLKDTVYRAYLKEPDESPLTTELRFDDVERKLKRNNIRVVNLKEDFIKAAGNAINSQHYIYGLDDSHWNAEGIRIAAERVARELGKN